MTPYCPHCGTDLSSGTGWRTVGKVVPGVYDGVLFWSCPDCGGAWHRWPEGSNNHYAAERFIDAANAPAGFVR